MRALIFALVALLTAAGSAQAARLTATPANVEAVLAKAKGGDVVVLTGDFPALTLRRRTFEPALTLDLRAATLHGWTFRDVAGLRIQGGVLEANGNFVPKRGRVVHGAALAFQDAKRIRIEGVRAVGPQKAIPQKGSNRADGYGISFLRASDIEVVNSEFTGFKVGLLFGQTNRFKASNNRFRLMRADGMDIANSWHGLIEGNDFRDTYIVDKEHPDGIQMWSRPNAQPTSDIVIRRNTIFGDTQGISAFNHVRNGVDDGGFDRLTIADNDIQVSAPQALAVVDGRDIVVTGNRIRTLRGAKHRASLNLVRCTGVVRHGNVVEPGAGKPGIRD